MKEFQKFCRNKAVFKAADFRVINLKCVLYNGENEPIIKSGPPLKTDSGFAEYLRQLDENKIAHIGAGHDIEETYCRGKAEG